MDTERDSASEHPALDPQGLKDTSALSIKGRLRPGPWSPGRIQSEGSPTRSRNSAVTLSNCMAKPSSVRRRRAPEPEDLHSVGRLRHTSRKAG